MNNLIFIDADTDLDSLLGIEPETIEDLRAEADPDKNVDNDVIRAYGRAKPSAVKDGTVPAALAGDRGSRAEIAADLGYKTFVLRTWML
jgi:hypothetical protein